MNESDAKTLAAIKDEIRTEAERMRERTPHATLPKTHPRPLRRAEGERARLDYSIDELCRFPYTTFVDQAFRSILKRPPDPAGFEAHVRLLGSGASKIEILGNLRYSAEGRAIGARIPGLLPRYVLAKLHRVPVLGYASAWIVALGGLPRIVQQVRAIDTAHFARSFDIDAAGRKLREEVGELRDANERLAESTLAAQALFEAQRAAEQQALRGELEELAARSGDSHLALSMNHWLTELRRNLGRLEDEEFAQRRKVESLLADVVARRTHGDAARASRLAAWSGLLAARLAPRARILDLGSGMDWLVRLADAGFDAATVDSAAGSPRSDAIVVVPGTPAAVLERTGAGALDALTVLAAGSLLRRLPATTLLESARRTLKPGGLFLLAFDLDADVLADRLAGLPPAVPDADLLVAALGAAGFIDIVPVQNGEDVPCLVARNPQPGAVPA